MTLAEAISVLNMVEAYGLADDAKKMAIRSLEAWEKVRTELEENRDDWIKGLDPEWHTYDRCIAIINKHLAEVKK